VDSANLTQYRFGLFLFDPSSGVLSKSGTPIRLQEQPARVLSHLLEHPAEMVTRQSLQNLLWPEGVNVDFESGLNSTMRRLRQVLLDDADRPRYIETVPKRGYRFIATVEILHPETASIAPPPPISAPPTRRRYFLAAGSVAATGVTSLAWFLWKKPSRPAPVQSSILLPPGQTLPVDSGNILAISPDGQYLAYCANSATGRQLFIRSLASGKSELVPNSSNCGSPRLLDSNKDLTWATYNGLFRSQSGQLQTLVNWPIGASMIANRISSDGDLLYMAPVPLAEGAASGLTSDCWLWTKGDAAPRRIDIPFGGKGLETLIPQDLLRRRYLIYSSIIGPQARSLWILDLNTGIRKLLITPAMGGHFLPGNRILYYWAGNLLVSSIDLASMRLTGQPTVVQAGVASASWTGPEADLSTDGTLVFVPERPLPDWHPVWVGLDGKQTPIPVPPGPFTPLDLAADIASLLLIRRTANGLGTLLTYNLNNGATVELAKDVDLRACFSPDRKRVAFSKAGPGEWLPSLHFLNLQTREIEWRLPFSGVAQFPMQWHPSGDTIFFCQGFHPKTMIDVYSVNFRNEKSVTLVAGGGFSQIHPKLSPNGRWLAYSAADNKGTIHIKDLQQPAIAELVIPGNGLASMWSKDSSKLYFRSARAIIELSLTASPQGLVAGNSKPLFEGDFLESNHWDRHIFFDQPNQRFLLAKPDETVEAPRRIDVITNWLSTLG